MAVRSGSLLVVLVFFAVAAATEAQTWRPAPAPAAVADNESWYVAQGPLAVAGGVFYPSGPTIHFLPNEMFEIGYFERVPVYGRSTMERRSVIYVPLAGGLMRPYERLRTGDLAGTVGSASPTYPVAHPSDPFAAPAPIMSPQTPIDPFAVGTTGFVTARAPVAEAPPADPVMVRLASQPANDPPFPSHPRLASAETPVGLNGVFIQFRDARWFADGPSVSFTAERFSRIGEYRGFGVFEEKGHAERIYVALFQGQPGLMSPYRQR